MITTRIVIACILINALLVGCMGDQNNLGDPQGKKTDNTIPSTTATSPSIPDTTDPDPNTPDPAITVTTDPEPQPSYSSICFDDVEAGGKIYAATCERCHGLPEIASSGIFYGPRSSMDIFDSKQNYYQDHTGQRQALPFNDFVAMFMPSINEAILEQPGNQITAYLTHRVGRAWCPGEDWPPVLKTPGATRVGKGNSFKRVLMYSKQPSTIAEKQRIMNDLDLRFTWVLESDGLRNIMLDRYDFVALIGLSYETLSPQEQYQMNEYLREGGQYLEGYQSFSGSIEQFVVKSNDVELIAPIEVDNDPNTEYSAKTVEQVSYSSLNYNFPEIYRFVLESGAVSMYVGVNGDLTIDDVVQAIAINDEIKKQQESTSLILEL